MTSTMATTTTAAAADGAVRPLTTFAPPANCLASDAFFEVSVNNTAYFVQGPRGTSTLCFPPSYSAQPTSLYYSPGWCPNGYTPACSSVSRATETHFTCCPDMPPASFECGGPASDLQQPWLGCVSRFTTPITVPTVQRVGTGGRLTNNIGRQTYTPPPGSGGGTGTVNAFSVHVARQSTDTRQNPDDNDSNGTSPGTAVGVGVGVGVGVAVLLLVIGAYLFWRRRRATTSTRQRDDDDEKTAAAAAATGTSGSPAKIPNTPVEMSAGEGQQQQQAKKVLSPVEMSGEGRPAELPHDDNAVVVDDDNHYGGAETPLVEVMGDALPPGSTHMVRP